MSNDKTVADLHQQTAKIEWRELQRFFAQGLLLKVAKGQDLVQIASFFVDDNKKAVNKLIENKQLEHCTDDDARRWQKNNQVLWAVVAAPWVLVQEASSG